MPHAVFLLSATLLATAAGHISGNGETVSAQLGQQHQTQQIIQHQQARIVTTSKTEILRPAPSKRWVF